MRNLSRLGANQRCSGSLHRGFVTKYGRIYRIILDLLRCYVLIDLKTDTLVHQDLGQMQMYVNYYDRFEKQEHENPSIGILLCTDKNDAVVKITLPENSNNIIASKYQLYLPTEQQLIEEVQKEIDKMMKE